MSDERLRPVLAVAGVTIVIIAAVLAATWGVYRRLGPVRTPGQPDPAAAEPAPALDLGEARRAWLAPIERRMRTYGWVDRAAGRVRVPVERAAELVLSEGLPTADDIGAEP